MLRRQAAAAFALLMLSLSGGLAQPLSAPDYEVKAGFLYNFAKLTEWPTNAFRSDTSSINIGVLGADEGVLKFLETATSGRTIHNRSLSVTGLNNIQNVTNCHVLFIASSERANLSKILTIVGTRPILTVAEIDQFTELGGVIRLVKENDGFHFELRKGIADLAGLKFSSKLLALAKIKRENGKERP